MTHPASPHRLSPLRPRDPHEAHRVASPLELLFDLTFAVAFSTSGGAFAHLIAEGHVAAGLFGFVVSCGAIVWAWINFTWFASAYDNDDIGTRLMAMVIMVGVVVMALGIPAMYASVDAGGTYDGRVMVLGYVVMRLGMLIGWGRAYRADAARRPAIRVYIVTLLVAQAGWIAMAFSRPALGVATACMAVLWVVEFAGPYLAAQRASTPWHPHHIAERYGLLAIITLGEGIIGTVAALSAAFTEGHRLQAGLVVVAGIGLTFGMWWIYFSWSPAEILERYRGRSFAFGYLHLPLFAAIAAVGAGLHVAGYWVEGEAHIPEAQVVAAVAIPVAVYIAFVFAIYYALHRGAGRQHWAFHTAQLALSLLVAAAGVGLAMVGVDLGYCLLVVMLAPYVTVLGYEIWGHGHIAADQDHLLAAAEGGAD